MEWPSFPVGCQANLCFLLSFVETGSHMSQAGLELTMELKMTLPDALVSS